MGSTSWRGSRWKGGGGKRIPRLFFPFLKGVRSLALNTLLLKSCLPEALHLQSHPPVTGVLKWEIHESALGSAPEGAPENRGAPGGGSRECSGKLGVLQGVLPRAAQCGASTERALSGALPGAPPISLSTLGSTPWSTPISRSTLGSTSESTFMDFPL